MSQFLVLGLFLTPIAAFGPASVHTNSEGVYGFVESRIYIKSNQPWHLNLKKAKLDRHWNHFLQIRSRHHYRVLLLLVV